MPHDKIKSKSWPDRLLMRVTLASAQHAQRVVIFAVILAVCAWAYASQLRIEGSFVALLPSDSPTALRFKEALERKLGGNATLIVMSTAESEPANRAFVDALSAELEKFPKSQVFAVEKGPGEAREFFKKWRWLFASRYDLAVLQCKIARERSKRQPGNLDLEDEPCEDSVEFEKEKAGLEALEQEKEEPEKLSADEVVARANESELQKFEREIEARLESLDPYPTGYFQNEDGSLFSILIRAPSAGMGEFSSDKLLAAVELKVGELKSAHPGIEVGYAGDIPNAIEQRDALISDMATISLIAIGLIWASIILYFRSFVSLLQIGFCVTVGCGFAFAVAMAAYGRLNTATSFLGAIIAGNGINYGIVYLARYRELRTKGLEREESLVEAALASRKGTWLAAVAASGAYGALLLTSFRGFSEFGLIGGVGMVLCWLATFAILPAIITTFEMGLAGSQNTIRPTQRVALGVIANLANRKGIFVLLGAGVLTLAAAYPLKGYLADPWEYNFGNLGSRSSRSKGAGNWSHRSNKVFKSRGSPMLVMADEMSEVLDIERQLHAQDKRVTDGKYIERVETIYDRLGGSPKEVKEKLKILADIRDDIDSVGSRLIGDDKRIAHDWRPPDYLRPLTPADLPELVQMQFREKDGTVGTPLYVYLNRHLSQSNGHNLLRISEIFESVRLADGSVAPNASRSTVFAAMIRAMERDGPLATLVAFLVVTGVIIVVARRFVTTISVLGALLCGVILTVGGAAWLDVRLNFLNFVALPLTFGIGVEYAINLYERIDLTGSISKGLDSIGGPVALCSLTTVLGYGALIFADNMALQSFGRYAIAGEIACIVAALFVLPAALRLGNKAGD